VRAGTFYLEYRCVFIGWIEIKSKGLFRQKFKILTEYHDGAGMTPDQVAAISCARQPAGAVLTDRRRWS
jgi:glycerol kinase